MKYLLLIFKIVIPSLIYANQSEIVFEGQGKAEINGFTFKNNSKFQLFKSKGYWKSSAGDFGTNECLGTLSEDKDNKKGYSVYCKNISQNDDYFIMKFFRESTYDGGGIGKALIIETSDNYKHYLNLECTHAITYKELDYFGIQKCKLENN